MENFSLYNPTRLHLGRGVIGQRLGRELPPGARVLVLIGGGSVQSNGVLSQVEEALTGRAHFLFSGIEANPDFDTLMQAVALGREARVDWVLAVGGGSVVDGAKFVAAALALDLGPDPWLLVTRQLPVERALPLGVVLTLPGTGSEMNAYTVISRRSQGAKLAFGSRHLFPRFSLLDPETTYSLPRAQVALGLADAYTHVLEQYLTYPAGGIMQDHLAEATLRTLHEILPRVLETTNPDYEARAALMYASTVALNGYVGAGVPQDWTTHTLGHELTAERGTAHAATLAALLPHRLRLSLDQKQAKLARYGRMIFGLTGGLTGDEERALAEGAINRLEGFLADELGLPTRAVDHGFVAADIDRIIERLETRGMAPQGEHGDVGLPEARAIYEASIL